MPFYEYECSNCKFYSEVMQKITDAPLTKCPSCGKKALKKLVSAPNFRLKGGGWYETDFKGDKENKRNLAGADHEESAAKTESAASATSKADASSKTEASKSETSKTESGSGEAASKPAAAKADGGAESKGASGRRPSAGVSASGRSGSGGRSSGSGDSGKAATGRAGGGRGGAGTKAPVRTAASKARPAISKGKAKSTAARKKGRR